ncbi:MAG: chemotaxis-specific protein-glutamate methyltransferase CheB [Chloroflexi bacterium]|nr:chemotaxis-specific protein-glutamate methyltransferase CheB [Chloroflexota bacterium]
MVRVLIVEDSPTIQMLLKAVLESDPAIQVIGIAANGREGLERATALRPDLITMDIHMPGMDGFEATRRIMEQCPTPIIVVSSSVDSAELPITFNAIQAGALEVIEKPVGFRGQDYENIRERLTTTVKLMAEVKVIRRRFAITRPAITEPALAPLGVSRLVAARGQRIFSLVAIGSSTGGPAALNVLIKALPADFSLPVVIVQHMSAGFMGGLISWLQGESKLPLKMAAQNEPPRPGTIYFAPDDTHIELVGRNLLGLNTGPMINHVRPSVDVLFHSIAKYSAPETVAVLLTGMGEDGAVGLKAIHDCGGLTIAQDEATSVVYGMPKAAALLGAVDHILPLSQIATTLLEIV